MKPMFYGSAPVFFVSDIHRSVDYYCDVLGFERPYLWGDPPFFAMPKREGIIIMLEQVSSGSRNNLGSWDAYFWVRDAGNLFKEFKKKGAKVLYPPELKKEYGCFEFAVKDPDDHILAFGQEVDKHPFFETNPIDD